MKILLTGANGFIGSHLLRKLLDTKHEVVVLTRKLSNLSRIKNQLSVITIIYYEDKDFLEKIYSKKIDIVIHLAGVYVKSERDMFDIEEMNNFNINMSTALLYSAIKHNVKGFINTGTFFEYDLRNTQPIHEKSVIKPFNYYAATKIAFETILKYAAHSSKTKAVTLKLFSPYGERDNDKVIPLIIKSFLTDSPLVLDQSGQKLSFTYIEDIIEAYMNAITYMPNNTFEYEDFNIGINNSYSIQDVVNMIQKIAGKKSSITFRDVILKKNTINIVCQNQKAMELLQWKPKTELYEGLKKTYNYYKKII